MRVRSRPWSPLQPPVSDAGAALLLVLVTMTCLAGLGLAIASVAAIERVSAADEGRAVSIEYAAEAGAQFAADELARVPDWTHVPAGLVQSARHDGNPRPMTPWGTPVDVAGETGALQRQTDSSEDLGANATRWQLFFAGSLSRLVSDSYDQAWPLVLVWVGDDGADGDGQALFDANATVRVRSRAFGPVDMQRDVEAVIHRAGAGVVQIVDWHLPR